MLLLSGHLLSGLVVYWVHIQDEVTKVAILHLHCHGNTFETARGGEVYSL